MTVQRVLATLACVLSLVMPFSLRASEGAQETNCSPMTVPTLQSAKTQLEAVRAAIADDPSLGEASSTISDALTSLQSSIVTITGQDPCGLSEEDTEAFFDGQELAVEHAMDLRSEGFLGGSLVEDAENAVRTIIKADQVLLIAMVANLRDTLPLDDSSSDPGFDPNQELSDAQTLQAGCELPAGNVACAPDDPTCDRDGSTCDDAIGKYSDLYSAIIEIIR